MNVPAVSLVGTLVCRDDTEVAAVLAHLPRHVELTRAEPGCVHFKVERDGDRPIWRVEEQFVDEPAFRTHQQRVATSEWGRATAGIERRYVTTGLSDDG